MGDIPEPLAGHVVHLLRQPVVVLNTNIVNDSIQSSKYSTPLEEPGEISQIQGWGDGAGRSRVFLAPWNHHLAISADKCEQIVHIQLFYSLAKTLFWSNVNE